MRVTMLVSAEQVDLAPIPSTALHLAQSQWLRELTLRLAFLTAAQSHTSEQVEYGGAASMDHALMSYQQAVEEARVMVSTLAGEIRRRNRGEVGGWMDRPGIVRMQST